LRETNRAVRLCNTCCLPKASVRWRRTVSTIYTREKLDAISRDSGCRTVVDIGIHDAIGPDPLSQINARFMIRFCACTYVLVRPFVVQKSRTITATRIPGFRYLISWYYLIPVGMFYPTRSILSIRLIIMVIRTPPSCFWFTSHTGVNVVLLLLLFLHYLSRDKYCQYNNNNTNYWCISY